MMLFPSQEESIDMTPRMLDGVAGMSPARKKNRGRAYLMPNQNSNSQFSLLDKRDDVSTNDGYPMLGAISQDSNFSLSQFSQDFAERLGNMQMNPEDENNIPNIMVAASQEECSLPGNFNCFSLPSIPTKSTKKAGGGEGNGFFRTSSNSSTMSVLSQNHQVGGGNHLLKSTSTKRGYSEPEKQIELRLTHENPFITVQNNSTEFYFQKFSKTTSALTAAATATTTAAGVGGANNNKKQAIKPIPVIKPMKLFVGAFKERPRYYTDFEELTLLGEGTFSSVFCVRNRFDGLLYAIKKIKERITSNNHQNLLLKEICALSYLNSIHCPNIIQYYSSWIYDDQLFLQVELCGLGTLEDLISSIPSKTSIVRASLISSYQQFPQPSLPTVANAPGLNISSSISNSLSFSTDGGNSNNDGIFLPNQERNRTDSFASVDPESNFGSQTPMTQPNNPHDPNNLLKCPLETVERGIDEDLGWLILREIAKTLDFMHKRDLVHLDIRPANIFIQANHQAPSSSSSSSFAHPQQNSSISQVSSHDHQVMLPSMLPEQQQQSHSSSLFANILSAKPLGSSTTSTTTSKMNPPVSKAQHYLQVRDRIEKMLLQSKYSLKLGDFGHCRSIHDKSIINEGETRYCPRELIDLQLHSIDLKKCDIFSLGASVYELCLGRFLGCENSNPISSAIISSSSLDNNPTENRYQLDDDDNFFHSQSNHDRPPSMTSLNDGGSHHGCGQVVEDGIEEWHSLRDGKLHGKFLISYTQEFIQLISSLLHGNPSQRPTAEEIYRVCNQHFLNQQQPHQQQRQGASMMKMNQEEMIQFLFHENQRLQQELAQYKMKC